MNHPIKHINNKITGIIFSDAAKQHIIKYLNPNNLGVHLSLKKSGCSGLSYVLQYDFIPQINDIVLPFHDNYQLYIAKDIYPFLLGTSVDYVKQNLNSKLIFNNPNQTGQCGCGESFTVD